MDGECIGIETTETEALMSSGAGPVETEQPSLNESTRKRAFSDILELDDDELSKVEEHLKNKIVKNCENFLHKHDQLRASYEKFKIEYEQRFIELEAEYIECQTRLEAESKNCHLFQLKASENGNPSF